MRTFKTLIAALAVPGLMAATAADAAATRSIQAKPKIAVSQRPVCAPGTVLRQTAARQGYTSMRCVQPEPPNDGGMGTATAAERVGGPGKAVFIVGALAAAGVGLGIAVGGGDDDDSPGG